MNEFETQNGKLLEAVSFLDFCRAVRQNKRADTLTPPERHDAPATRCYKMPGHEVYVAVIDRPAYTELVGLCSLEKGAGALQWAQVALATVLDFSKPVVLDCFDGFLVEQYTKMGFVIFGRVPFDIKISKPESLNGAEPDVVFMYHPAFPKPVGA